MNVLLFQTHVNDKKHGLEFDKDRISYRHKTFDAVISKDFREVLTKAMIKDGLKYPIELELGEDDYFLKPKSYTKADGTKGSKTRITILNAQSIKQGKFESKTLDQLCDIYDEEMRSKEADDIDEDWIKILSMIGELSY